MSEIFSDAEILRRVMDSAMSEMMVAMPGRVLSYDAANQVADIEPQLQRAVPGEDPENELDTLITLPTLPSVPVCFPRGGGFYMHFPLQPGDEVLVVFADRDINQWRASGRSVDPGVRDAHPLSGAMAIPGLFSRGNEVSDADASTMTFGNDGGLKVAITPAQMEVAGNSDAAALASKVDSLASAFNAHTHVAPAGGGPTGPPTPTYGAGPTGSTVLKVGS